jgi:hypothetical protein
MVTISAFIARSLKYALFKRILATIGRKSPISPVPEAIRGIGEICQFSGF